MREMFKIFRLAAQQQAAQSQHEHQQSQQSKSSLVSKSSQHLSSARHSPLMSSVSHNQSKLSHHRDQNRPKSHSPQPTNLSSSLMYDVKSMREGASGGAARLTPIAERNSEMERDDHRKSSPLHLNSTRDSHSPSYSNR